MPKIPWGNALFLDRDGVINQRPHNDYVRNITDFHFIAGVIESIAYLSTKYVPIVIVTNQQGIGKGLMTEDELHRIHHFMIEEINRGGGRIDKVYHCGDLANSNSLFRKPAPGMALKARKDFPDIKFKQSVMIGDTLTDMIFGKTLGMCTVLIDKNEILPRSYPDLINHRYESLSSFTNKLKMNDN